MQNSFAVFYAVLFGAMLSAEMGWNIFKYDPTDGSRPVARTIPRYAWRVLFLVVGRAVCFAVIYPALNSKLSENYWSALWQAFLSLVLCLPVFGCQQLLYGVSQDANPRAVKSSGTFAWVSVIGIAVIVWAALRCAKQT